MTTFLLRVSHLAMLAALLAACGGGGVTILNNASSNATQVSSIELDPSTPSIAKGTSTQLSATALYSDNSHATVTMDLSWSSSDPSVATVSGSGRISAVGTGTAKITGKCAVPSACSSAATTITVTVTAAIVVSIAITPGAPRLAPGTSQQFTATGTFSDHSTQNLSDDLIWSSSNSAVATVSSSGLVSSVGAGSAMITATCKAAKVCGSLGGTIRVTVTSATLRSIAITPSSPTFAPDTSQQFTATGTYSDNSTQNLSADLSWTSSNPAAATVSSTGLVSTVGTGTSTITATCRVVSVCGTVAGATTITVTSATLVSIAVTPHAPAVAVDSNVSFTATGTYSDNSTQNLTGQVTWASATAAVATISNAAGTSGVAHAVGAGTTQITAALGSLTSPGITLTVSAATLVSIAVTPTGPGIEVGGSEQFVATGTYSDNSTQVITTTVTWASADMSVATVSNASNSQGLATGLLAGSSSITATSGAVASPSVTLTVTARTESVLCSFGNGSDGTLPLGGVVQGTDGNFYGTTTAGGAYGNGTVFQCTPGGVETVFYSFQYVDGNDPVAGLILGTDGSFYGTTELGGSYGHGNVFKITSLGVESVVLSFAGGADGSMPMAGLIQGTDGNFYGTTYDGGTDSDGVVFKVTPGGTPTVLYSLGTAVSGTDAQYPYAGLTQGTDGNFYGTTGNGGVNGYGTVFEVTAGGTETVLWSFGGAGDGGAPYASVVQGANGNFYGTTVGGGTYGNGTVFEVTPGGVETVLYSFGNSVVDGTNPYSALILGGDGNFYGTTFAGGSNSYGTIFKITPAGAETVLWSFGAGTDGRHPYAGLFLGTDGHLYGTTESGGVYGAGTAFRY